jgi:hypothetical protein
MEPPNKKMNDYMMAHLFLRLSPNTLYNFAVLGYDYILDDYFWKKYCRMHNIYVMPRLTPKRCIQLWLKKSPVWTSHDDTPWDFDYQYPKTIWGVPEKAMIEYGKSKEVDDMIYSNLCYIFKDADQYQNTWIRYNTDSGYYCVIYWTPSLIMPFIRYVPFDKMQIGFMRLKSGEISWTIHHAICYYGETSDGLRQGNGTLLFDNGFSILRKWDDNKIYKRNIGKDRPDIPESLAEKLRDMLITLIKALQ